MAGDTPNRLLVQHGHFNTGRPEKNPGIPGFAWHRRWAKKAPSVPARPMALPAQETTDAAPSPSSRPGSFPRCCCRSMPILPSTRWLRPSATCRRDRDRRRSPSMPIPPRSPPAPSRQRRVMEIAADEVGDRCPSCTALGGWQPEAARIAQAAAAGGASALLVSRRGRSPSGRMPGWRSSFKRVAEAAPDCRSSPSNIRWRPARAIRRRRSSARGCGAADPRHQGLDQQCGAP